MEKNNGFIKFDDENEFKNWLDSQKISRQITKLQVHHTYAPSYDNWPEDEFKRQLSMKNYHINSSKFSDIAQHFTIFPNGKIVTGRDLNFTPAGISGGNSGAVCCEIYGNFDKDVMTEEQRQSVVAFYGIMCERFNLRPSSSTIVYHCWYTSRGVYLGDYVKGKSAKTCPGNKFFGGNGVKSFRENFLKEIKDCMENGSFKDNDKNNDSAINKESQKKLYIKKLQQSLNTSYNTTLVIDGLYGNKTKGVVTKHNLKYKSKNEHVKWLQEVLNKTRNDKLDVDGIFGKNTLKGVLNFQKENSLIVDGIAGIYTHEKLIEKYI